MKINTCRVCGHNFFKEYLLRFENMPKGAQFLPDEMELPTDRGVDLEVCQCSGCGLVQLSNNPVAYYREVKRAGAFSEEMKHFRKKEFSSLVQDYSLKGKRIIEIGCGRGEYLSLIQEAGADAFGLEHSAESVRYCLKKGLKVSEGFIQSSTDKINHAPFDAFFILNFLEHIPDPNSTLRGIANNLRATALGIVEVPNFDMILRNKLFSEFIGDHLFYFTKETLASALKLNGFEILACNEVWHDYVISAVVKKRTQLDISSFSQYQSHLRNELEKYIARFNDKKVAIWGAGHQALAVISLTNLSGKIRYVVDSAVFKQGKYTAATHIPIVSPDTLNSDPVEAVIVMAGSYSDEIARILAQRHDRNVNISILRDFRLEDLGK